MTEKKSLATVWLDGCSGCHMSFLDLDERLLEVMEHFNLVYSPLIDLKDYPEDVEVALVEGSVGSVEDRAKIRKIREKTRILVSLGDCAVTGNIPAMRNSHKVEDIIQRAYFENVTNNPSTPSEIIPALMESNRPVHETVKVDLYIPGCPPSADTIYYALSELAEGRMPNLESKTRFGA